ncbi:SUR7/Pali family protein [Ceratobasidium sp. AG-Ba]|nr:SUR7/Pali family protein [Ceratobasidium sp. AG-Ba]
MVQIFRPATPGFLTTLAATALLAVVSFSVPYFKSIYFLKAAISQSGTAGSVTFGVLGYCLDFNNQITCSNPTVGWEFNPNALLGNDLPIQIPNVVVKWITYALVLHIVALGLAGVSAIFGLLAHVREMSMSCFSSCISGMGAAVCLVAFIFDLVLFFAVRARVNAVQGGSATIGNGLWMTLAAWVLLFFAGCMFSFGRCCVSKRPSFSKRRDRRRDTEDDGNKYDRESERMRLDAVKAEADRKARQKAGPQEVGLPAFYEHERTPLRREEPQYYEEEVEVMAPYSDSSMNSRRTGSRSTRNTAPGAVAYQPHRAYEPGAPGTRAIDDYYNGTAPVATDANTYPPQRQASQHQQPYEPQRHRTPSHDTYGQPQQQQNVPPVPAIPQRYQSPNQDPYQQGYQQPGGFTDPYAAQQQQQRHVDPYLAYGDAGQSHGHQPQDSSYYSAPSHQQYPSAYAQHQQPQQAQDPYANATSSYNPQAAVMSPPEATHYQGYDQQNNYGYDQQYQQGYDQQQRGYDHYDPQQAYNAAAQQAYVQPEPVHYNQPAAAYDPYHERQQSQGPVRQPTMPLQPVLANEPTRMLAASPSPMDGQSPPYTPAPHAVLAVDTSGVPPAPRGPRSAGAGPSTSQPQAQQWSATSEGSSEAPPQYTAVGPSTTTTYPPEKR